MVCENFAGGVTSARLAYFPPTDNGSLRRLMMMITFVSTRDTTDISYIKIVKALTHTFALLID